MTARRTAVEIGILVGGLAAAVAFVVWIAGLAADGLATRVPVEVDRALGRQSFESILQSSEVCHDPATQKYVQRVTTPLLDALDDPRFDFEVEVIDRPSVNAFALPGGFVTVHFGLLEAAETGEEVAAVLAHEIQHVTERHGTARLLRQLGGGTVLYALFGGTDVAVPAALLCDFLSTAYDRDQERAADAGARRLLMEAGIDPGGMVRFFERLARSGPTPPALLSTHPDPGDRAEAAERAAGDLNATTRLPKPSALECH